MATIFELIIFLSAVTLFGVLLVRSIGPKQSPLEAISYGFLIGICSFTLIMFAFNTFGYSYTHIHVWILLTAVIFATYMLCLLLKRPLVFTKVNLKEQKHTPIERLIFVAIVILFMSSLAYNIYWPIADWDALTLYDFRARVFAQTGFMEEVLSLHRYYLGYPLFTSLAHTVIYLIGFSNPHFLYSLFYGTFLVIFYYSLRKVTSRTISLFFTFVLAVSTTIYSHSTLAYTNLPYTIYYSLGLINVYLWLKTKDVGCLAVSALLIGLSSWVRSSEPFWIAPVMLILYSSFVTKKWKEWFFYITTVILFKFPWNAYLSSKFPTELSGSWVLQQAINLDLIVFRFIEVLVYFYKNVLVKDVLIYLILFLSLFLIKGQNKPTKFFAFTIIFNLLTVFGGIYIYSFVYTKWVVVGDSVSRMSMIFAPLVIYLSALVAQKTILPQFDK